MKLAFFIRVWSLLCALFFNFCTSENSEQLVAVTRMLSHGVNIQEQWSVKPKGDHYKGNYTEGSWNYDYSQQAGSCPSCATTSKCGPYCWDKIESSSNQCGSSSQTPIDISTVSVVENSTLSLPNFVVTDGGCKKWSQFADDHAFEVSFSDAGCTNLKLVYALTEYTLIQFHYHAPSEHQINGKSADAELHMVHKSADGKLLVLGVLLVATKPRVHSFLDNFWAAAKAGASMAKYSSRKTFTHEYEVESAVPLSPYVEFLPASKSFYTYSGSLTTYPCTEGVTWLVFDSPISVGRDDVTSLVEGVKHQKDSLLFLPKFADNRPTKPLNGRTVQKFVDQNAKQPAKPKNLVKRSLGSERL